MTISKEDRALIAAIAFEAEQIAGKIIHPVLWLEAEEHIQDEALQRLDRVLDSLDPSIFGKVARSAAKLMLDAGVILEDDGDDVTPVAPVDAREPPVTAEVVHGGIATSDGKLVSPDDLLTGGTPEEGLESYTGEAEVAQPNHKTPEVPEFEVALRGEIQNPPTDDELEELTRPDGEA